MKYIFILSAIFMLASCQHKSSKEKAKEYWNNNQFELALIEISDAIKEHPDSSSFYTFTEFLQSREFWQQAVQQCALSMHLTAYCCLVTNCFLV